MAALFGLACGASAVLLAVIHVVLYSPVEPVSDLSRVVTIGGIAQGATVGDPVTWWSQAEAVECLATYRVGEALLGSSGMDRHWIRTAEVSSAFFDVFGLTLPLGRTFQAGDMARDDRLAVVSSAFWANEMGGPRAVGERIHLGGVSYEVIGVAPQAFSFPAGTQVWTVKPATSAAAASLVSGAGSLPVVPARWQQGWLGRIRDGASIPQVRSQLLAILQATNDELSPRTGLRYGSAIVVRGLGDSLAAPVRTTLQTVSMGAFFVLAAALAHLVAFYLSQSARRVLDVAVRQALGASAWHLRASAFSDAAVLGVASAIAATVASIVLLGASRALLGPHGLTVPPLGIFWAIPVVMTWLAAACVGTIAGIAVVRRAMRADLGRLLSLRSSAQVGVIHGGIRKGLLAGTAALAMPLMAGAALTTFAFVESRVRDRGFETSDRVMAQVRVLRRDALGEQMAVLLNEAVARLRMIPGVRAASAVSSVPILKEHRQFVEASTGAARVMAGIVEVSGDPLEALGLRLLRGESQVHGSRAAVVINAKLARALWDERDPLGQMLTLRKVAYEVIGVVAPTRASDEELPVPEVYVPTAPVERSGPVEIVTNLIATCPGACDDSFVASVTSAIHDLPLTVVRNEELASYVDRATRPLRARAIVWIVYAVIGVGIALLGLSGLTAQLVSARYCEVGVRVALGATPWSVVWLLSREVLTLAVTGVVVGAVGARACVTFFEPRWVAGVPVVGGLVTLSLALACAMCVGAVVPILRAARQAPRALTAL